MKQKPRKRTALTHVSADGEAQMVDVGDKRATRRRAVAEAWVRLSPAAAALLRQRGGRSSKGNVVETARLAGIMAAKRTAELIPLCHPLMLDAIDMKAELLGDCVRLVATTDARGPTGVEMEALTAAAVAALTVYDMLKAVDKGIEIGPVRLLEKRGGKSGHWARKESANGPH